MHAFRMFFAKHEEQARLSQRVPQPVKDQVTRRLTEAYAATFPQRPSQRGLFAQQGAWRALTQNRAEARARHARVFKDAGLVAIPLQCAEANLTAAYARAVCEEAYTSGPSSAFERSL